MKRNRYRDNIPLSQIFDEYEPYMSFGEIARVLGTSRNNIQMTYQRAMTKLIKKFGGNTKCQ